MNTDALAEIERRVLWLSTPWTRPRGWSPWVSRTTSCAGPAPGSIVRAALDAAGAF